VVYDEVLKGSGRDVEYDTLLSDYLEFWSEDMNKKRDYLPKHLRRGTIYPNIFLLQNLIKGIVYKH